jgi:hypothetical protein
MIRRFPAQAEQWSQVTPDSPVVRINWPRVAFAGLLLATVVTSFVVGFRAASRYNAQAASRGPSATAVSSALQAAPLTLQLVTEATAEGTDERLPLAISVEGPSEAASGAAIEIIGLPTGWALSAGRQFGEDGWRLSVAKLSGAALLPRAGFSGAIDLVAELRLADDTVVERRSLHLRIDPAPAAMPPQPIEPVGSMAMESPPTSASSGENVAGEKLASNRRGPDSEQIALLLRVADGLLATGDVSAARTVLRRAADAGDAGAALLLVETWRDPPSRP